MTFRLLVYGGRYFADADWLNRALDAVHAGSPITTLIHGACPVANGGADLLADAWARVHSVPVESYPVDHVLDGPWPGAGPRRNARMLKRSCPDAAVEFSGGRGTRDMRTRLIRAGVPVL